MKKIADSPSNIIRAAGVSIDQIMFCEESND